MRLTRRSAKEAGFAPAFQPTDHALDIGLPHRAPGGQPLPSNLSRCPWRMRRSSSGLPRPRGRPWWPSRRTAQQRL